MAAADGRRDGVIQPGHSEREAWPEAVKAAIELGVDVNAANAEGRTALDAAKALKYDTVVKFLVEQGAGR
jgi:ankyrin repeat protein